MVASIDPFRVPRKIAYIGRSWNFNTSLSSKHILGKVVVDLSYVKVYFSEQEKANIQAKAKGQNIAVSELIRN